MEGKKNYSEAQKRAIYKYREKNKDKVADVLANWKLKNADHIKEYSAQYYQKNKIEFHNKANQKHNCCCGGKYTYAHKCQHEKSKKHQNYINNSKNIKLYNL